MVCALSASYISTFAGYPVCNIIYVLLIMSVLNTICFAQLDSIKSRLQTTKQAISIPKLAALVYREEGVIGFYRGLWIPLMTISFVRTWTCYHDTLPRPYNGIPFLGAASFTIYSRTKEYCRYHHFFNRNTILNVSTTGGIG